MVRPYRRPIPERHPVRALLRSLTERGFSQVHLSEGELIAYVSDMLVRFIHVDDLYRLKDERGAPLRYLADMLQYAEDAGPIERREAYRHIGDFTLFFLGFFPESLEGGRRPVGPDYYVAQGRRSYERAAEMSRGTKASALLHRLSDRFETCVLGLNWVREYARDPFYQYMLRQYGLM